MHSTLVRAQNVFGFFTTVAFFVAALTAVSVFLYPVAPTAEVDIRNVKVMKGRQTQMYYQAKQQEFAQITFDLDADLTSLFNWNTKQVFAYLSVVYPGRVKGSKYSDNEAVIWDAIIQSPKSANLHMENKRAKYNINDISGAFRERNATMKFSWNIQPHVGALVWGSVDLAGEPVPEDDVEQGSAWDTITEFTFPPVGQKKVVKRKIAERGDGEEVPGAV